MSSYERKTTCAYCGVGCGIKAVVSHTDIPSRNEDSTPSFQITVSGDEDHPANYGRLCGKGSALAETAIPEGRLLQPRVNGQVTDWNTAIGTVVERFKAIKDEHGPEAIAFYLSGQLLTEDYYVANKLMKGFIGSSNVDTNSRLCMSSAVSAHKRAFGEDVVPGCYDDLEQADLLILTGSNTAWCHPVLFQRIRAAKASRPELKIVVIDPRRTATCDIADLHLALAPGTDSFLFNGLLSYLHTQGKINQDFLSATEGFDAALASARQSAPDIRQTALACDVDEQLVKQFFDWFADTDKTVTAFSQGINQSSRGSDKGNSIINCHLATGRIGKPGATPFSLTGQPNAMGGREVGGLANQLAAHMDFTPEDIDRVSRFWATDTLATAPGLKAVDLFRAVREKKIKAIWIMATNPVVSLPDANQIKAALSDCDFVVVSDCIAETDTTAFADVLLPSEGWSEKDGTVTNSERRISRQRRLVDSIGKAKPDWWIITQVARGLGFGDAFDYGSARDIFVEHARLSGFENNVQHHRRAFDISLYDALSESEYDDLAPFQWPAPRNNAVNKPETTSDRLFGDQFFYTTSGKAQFVPVLSEGPHNSLNSEYPLALNTGRIRDQWHTMTRTSLARRLNEHKPEPFVEIHPDDAVKYGLEPGSLATVTSAFGSMIARVEVTDTTRQGSLFVPMHWTEQMSSAGRVGALVNPVVDPVSGQPESKFTPARIQPYRATWHGFVLSHKPLTFPGVEYVVKVPGTAFFRYELAGASPIAEWNTVTKRWLEPAATTDTHWLDFEDTQAHRYRAAVVTSEGLQCCVFLSAKIDLPERSWLAGLFTKETLSDEDRRSILAGRPPSGTQTAGRTICSCFGVGENTLKDTIREKGLSSVEQIGDCLKAGTNCGSCVPELRTILNNVSKTG
ncbi:anaerobic dehydrogenase [Oleiphilus messinensis]|uniref:Anaerobic dehydrogenase n=1 Tax=Oleiphilus messinensis TaxID=141451 RepID=A0A1Y0IDB6_9GAMM|nr:nitrate reductase [Oleiphilus messinensis]ARU58139.1 anaerobic dehydrogenase [Oleiphilus messinensis]